MYTPVLFLTLLLLPILNAERLQTAFDNNDDLLMQRSVAANYLFSLPIRRYQHRLLDSSALPGSIDSDDQSQQRAKRIYWENLAFHAADYNQKPKKV